MKGISLDVQAGPTELFSQRLTIGGTIFSEAVFSEYDNIESLLKENPVLVPQFWYAIGTIRYKNTPEDAYAKDWQVVQCLSMTTKEEERVSGKLGGVKLVEIQ